MGEDQVFTAGVVGQEDKLAFARVSQLGAGVLVVAAVAVVDQSHGQLGILGIAGFRGT